MRSSVLSPSFNLPKWARCGRSSGRGGRHRTFVSFVQSQVFARGSEGEGRTWREEREGVCGAEELVMVPGWKRCPCRSREQPDRRTVSFKQKRNQSHKSCTGWKCGSWTLALCLNWKYNKMMFLVENTRSPPRKE